jgi:hypothetical protein
LKTERDLGRVKIHHGKFGMTVTKPDGTLLRGSSPFIFKWGRISKQTDHLNDDEYWKLLQSNGINSIRLVCFDPWQRSHGEQDSHSPYPYADLENQDDVEALLRDVDHVVEIAARHGMHVMINYHDTGGYTDPDYESFPDKSKRFKYASTMNYITKFWSIMAPRYANREHVFFELMNEPVQWFPEQYTDQVLKDIKTLSDHVRKLAPETHQVLISSANHISWQPEEHSILQVAQRLQKFGVDFRNSSVGLHAYNTHYPKPNSSTEIEQLMEEFAVINTEANLPKAMNETLNDPDGSGFDGDEFGVQSMERMGISWFHWKTATPEDFKTHFIGKVLEDAKTKGYDWRTESTTETNKE